MEEISGMPNISENFSTDSEIVYQPYRYDQIFCELFTVVGLLTILANCLIVFTILKFQKLRKNVTNILLVHLKIMQVMFFVLTPQTLRVNLMFRFESYIPYTVFCSFYEIGVVMGIAVVLFLILLILDGHLKLYHTEAYKKFTRVYNFFVIGIYVPAICFCALGISECLHGYIDYHLIITFLILAASVLILIVMNIAHLVKKRKLADSNKSTNLGLVISNIFCVFWIPLLLFIITTIFYSIYSPPIVVLLFTLGFSSPILNFFYLVKYYGDFYIFIRQIFKCQCNSYTNETLVEDPVLYNDNNGVVISVK